MNDPFGANLKCKMDVVQKIEAIRNAISTFSDDKVAISVVISDKFKCYRVPGHSSLSAVITSKLSENSASAMTWNMDDNEFSDNIIYPRLAKAFNKLTRDDMRQHLGVIIRAEQNRFGRKYHNSSVTNNDQWCSQQLSVR